MGPKVWNILISLEIFLVVLRNVQRTEFDQELKDPSNCVTLKQRHRLSSLSPFLDEDGVIREGLVEYLKKSDLNYDGKVRSYFQKNHRPMKLLQLRNTLDNYMGAPKPYSIQSGSSIGWSMVGTWCDRLHIDVWNLLEPCPNQINNSLAVTYPH